MTRVKKIVCYTGLRYTEFHYIKVHCNTDYLFWINKHSQKNEKLVNVAYFLKQGCCSDFKLLDIPYMFKCTIRRNSNKFLLQGSKQVPSSSPGQVDFLAGQVTFKVHLPNKGKNNWSSNRIINRQKQKVALTKQNMRAACPKDKTDFKIFQALYWFYILYSIFLWK